MYCVKEAQMHGMSYRGVHLFLALLKMVLRNGRDAGLWIQTRFSVSCQRISSMFPSWVLEIECKSIHGYIVRRLNFDRILGTAVFDMYSKCGALSWAYTLFDQTNSKNSISSNTMITSYKIHGYGKALSQTTIQRQREVGTCQCRVQWK